MKKQQYRQGDVLLERVDNIPATAKRVERKGPIILAFGKATGHHHSIASAGVEEWVDDAGVTYLDVQEAMAALVHQEHSIVDLPRGKYRKVQQREYTPAAIRNVAD
jgi:hypothetical protein